MFSIECIMSTDLVTLSPTSTVADARALMHEHRIHHLPIVTDDETLVGLLSLTDVLMATDSKLRSDGGGNRRRTSQPAPGSAVPGTTQDRLPASCQR